MWYLLDDELRSRIEKRIVKYTKRGFSKDGCIIWLGYCKGGNKIPYLHLSKDNVHYEVNIPQYVLEKSLQRKLRFSYQANHTCDNVDGPCVNIEHIYEGTHSQNMLDMYARGRRNITGENHPCAILTNLQVREIDALLKSGVQQPVLAKRYGVDHNTISQIKLRTRRADAFITEDMEQIATYYHPVTIEPDI